MRLLMLGLVVLAPGCGCSDLDFDDCAVDSDCPDDDDDCNGDEICTRGMAGLVCDHDYQPNCDVDEWCDDASGTCRTCDIGSPCHEDEPDSGVPAACGFPYGEHCNAECTLGCVEASRIVTSEAEVALGDRCTDACDPGAPLGCGDCAACVATVRVGNLEVAAIDVGRAPSCALRCEPSNDGPGCDRLDTSCDPATGTCEDACRADEECRLTRDETGAFVDDPSSTAVCNRVTGRCTTIGDARARAGDPCASDADCEDDGVCLRGGGWPEEGYCTRPYCQHARLACGLGEVCDYRTLEQPSCMHRCAPGREAEEDRAGVDGHGEGCAAGMSCRWDGATAWGACVPGNYNDVEASNVGARCSTDSECYSPYGLGRCAFTETGAGTCVEIDCDVLALPGLCDGASETCTEIEGSFACVRACTTAADCARGDACAPDATGLHVCMPRCASDTECGENMICAESRCRPT